MELTKQQKVGSLLAAAAIAALGVDRLLLGGGGPATAAAQDVPLLIEGPAQGEATLGSVPTEATLATRLAAFASSEGITPDESVPDLFAKRRWTIRGVFGEGERGGVKIGSDLVHVNGEYQGATLVRVCRDGAAVGAVFVESGREFFVPLETPGLSPRANDR